MAERTILDNLPEKSVDLSFERNDTSFSYSIKGICHHEDTKKLEFNLLSPDA